MPCFASAPGRVHVHSRDNRQPDDEIDAGEKDREAVVSARDPRRNAVRDRTENCGKFHGEAPQTEKFRTPGGRTEKADQRAARRLAGAEAEADEVGGEPEQRRTFREPGEHDRRDPAEQREHDRAHVAEPVLHLPECKCTRGSRHVDDQYERKRVFRRKTHRLLRVNRSERDDRLDAGLIEHETHEKTREVAIARGIANGFAQPAYGTPHDVVR